MSFRVTSRKIHYQDYNGENLDQNLTEFTENLADGITERIRAIHKVAVSSKIESSVGNPLFIDGNVLYRINGGDFTDGFWIGDTISVYNANISGFEVADRVITNIQADQIDFDGAPHPDPAFGFEEGALYNKTPLRAFEFSFGIIGNDEAFNTISKIDNNNQSFYSPTEVGSGPVGSRDTTFQACTPLGTDRSWHTRDSVQVRFVQDLPFTLLRGYEQEFEVDHICDTGPFFLDGELGNLLNDVVTELFQNGKSLKYVFDVSLKTFLTNPNTTKFGSYELSQGSVGWYNRSYNGLNNQYSPESIEYFDDATAAQIDAIQVGGITNTELIINSDDATFQSGHNVILDIFYLASEVEYRPDPTDPSGGIVADRDVYENFIKEKVVLEINGSNNNSGFIIDATATLLSASQIQIDFQTQYGVDQQSRLDQLKYYAISATVSDQSLPMVSSDKVSLLSDVRQFIKSTDVPDLFTIKTNTRVFGHHEQYGVDAGFTDLKGWIEDGVLLESDFGLAVDEIARLESLEVSVIAHNQTSGEIFNIDKFNIPLSSAVVDPNGFQLFSLDQTRNYKLGSNSQFNWVKLTHEGSTFIQASTINPATNILFNEYKLLCGYKVPWETWQAIQAYTGFYNSSEDNNGLNKNTSNYSDALLPNGDVNPFTVHFAVSANVSVNNVDSLDFGTVTTYVEATPELSISDSEEDSSTPGWTCSIETETLDGTNLEGGFSNTENTLIRTTITPDSGDTSVLTNPIMVVRLDRVEGGPISINELSSFWGSASNNPLTPVSPNTHVVIVDFTTHLEAVSIMDYTLMDTNIEHRISSRWYCEDTGTPAGVKTMEDGTTKTMEDTSTKTLDE